MMFRFSLGLALGSFVIAMPARCQTTPETATAAEDAPRFPLTDRPDLIAMVMQNGAHNTVALEQSGSDNRAALEQLGDRNVMSVRQAGSGNRVDWRQIGDDLPDLAVRQVGSMELSIVQIAGPR